MILTVSSECVYVSQDHVLKSRRFVACGKPPSALAEACEHWRAHVARWHPGACPKTKPATQPPPRMLVCLPGVWTPLSRTTKAPLGQPTVHRPERARKKKLRGSPKDARMAQRWPS
eukprot:2121104-Prymnesium_polylepis.1